jgi:hypothetical protein
VVGLGAGWIINICFYLAVKINDHGGDMMRQFTRGMIIGGLIGASVSVLTGTDVLDPRMKKRMFKSGKKIIRRSNVLDDMIHMFR